MKKVLTQQKFNKIHQLQRLISSKLFKSCYNNQYHFLKQQNEDFQMHIKKITVTALDFLLASAKKLQESHNF